MKFIYRPVRSSLVDSLSNAACFSSLKELIDFVVSNSCGSFEIRDVYISYYGFDERIACHCFVVCVGKFGHRDYLKEFRCPQIIGFLTIN